MPVVREKRATHQCDCPVCGVSRALGALRKATDCLDAATDAWVERTDDMEMTMSYRIETLEAVVERAMHAIGLYFRTDASGDGADFVDSHLSDALAACEKACPPKPEAQPKQGDAP